MGFGHDGLSPGRRPCKEEASRGGKVLLKTSHGDAAGQERKKPHHSLLQASPFLYDDPHIPHAFPPGGTWLLTFYGKVFRRQNYTVSVNIKTPQRQVIKNALALTQKEEATKHPRPLPGGRRHPEGDPRQVSKSQVVQRSIICRSQEGRNSPVSTDSQKDGQAEYGVSPVKRKEILTLATAWMDLEDTVLSDMSQSHTV